MDDPNVIGARIRQARVKKGLTQVDLAAAIGISRAHLTNVEGGNGSLALDKLSLLASETGTTVAWLIGEAGAVDPAKVDLLAAYDALDVRDRETLLRIAKSMRPTTPSTDEPSPRPKRRATGCVVSIRRLRGSRAIGERE